MTHPHGGHVVAEALERRGVAHVYGQDSPEWLFSVLPPERYTIMRDERSAGFAADAHARLTRQPVAATGIHGPGFMNLLPALLEAKEAGSPVIALVSGIETSAKGRGVFQELDQLTVASGVVKHAERVERADRVDEVIDRAITIATSGRPGPVLVELPNDVLQSRADWSKAPSDAPSSARGVVARDQSWSAPAELLARLASAARPVLLFGSGARGVDHATAVGVAEALGAAVCVTAMGRGSFPETHPAFGGVAGFMTDREDGSGAVANELLRQADVVVAIGSALDGVTTDGGRLPAPGCEVVRVDRVDEVLAADTRSTWRILAEASSFLDGLSIALDAAAGATVRPTWADADMRSRWDGVRAAQRSRALGREDVLTPSRLMRALDGVLEPEDIVVADAAYSSIWALSYLTQGRHFHDTIAGRGAGTLGFGFPAAIGAARAHPDRRIVALVGDGGFGFGWSELETAARAGLNITCIVLNNSQFAYQVLWHELNGPAARGLEFASVRHDLVAAAVGARGQQIAHPGELESALRDALKPGLSLLDVVVAADELPPFRKERHVGH